VGTFFPAYRFTPRFLQVHGGASGMSLTPCQADYISGSFSAAVRVVFCIGSAMCTVLPAYQFTPRFLQVHGGTSGMSLTPCQGDYVSSFFSAAVQVVCCIGSTMCIVLPAYQFTLRFLQIHGGASGMSLIPSQGDYVSGSFLVEV
jgi:hypothetical protein